MRFSTDYHNSADKVSAIEYVKKLMNKFQLILWCNLDMEVVGNPIKIVTFLLNLSVSTSNPFHRIVSLRKCSDSWWSQMLPEKHQSKFHQITVSSLDKKKWFQPGTDKQCVVHIYRLHMWKVFWQSKYEDITSQQSTYFNDFSSAFFWIILTGKMVKLFALCSFGIFRNTCVWYDCITRRHSFRSWILKI